MEDLREKLALHKEWLLDDIKGTRLDLSGEDLRYANLRYVDLSGAYLSGADLRYANLRGANLRYAKLRGANFSGADLRYCVGNNKEIKSLQIGTYLISYTKDILNIGCQSHEHADWRTFSDSIILNMDGQKALDWWNLNKNIILELIDR